MNAAACQYQGECLPVTGFDVIDLVFVAVIMLILGISLYAGSRS